MQVFGWCKPICICHSDPTNSQLYYIFPPANIICVRTNTKGWKDPEGKGNYEEQRLAKSIARSVTTAKQEMSRLT